MQNALIGHTGFVGSNLHEQGSFNALFNSKNFQEMRNCEFDTIWCSGISAVKWWANQNPENDWQEIEPLLEVLKTVKAKHFVLLSTVDVFKNCTAATEETSLNPIGLHPYGAHRAAVENFVRDHFVSHTIVRLPGLFGKQLKKNIIYDFLNNNEIYKIHADNIFQFYSLDTIYDDIMTAVNSNCDLIHFATEPVAVKDIARVAFNMSFDNKPDYAPVSYDMHTKHAGLYGEKGNYIQSADTVLNKIAAFVANYRE